MKKLLLLSVIFSLFFSCTSRNKMIQNKNTSLMENVGTNYENAIIIEEKTETSGVRAEYDWLIKNYPGYTNLRQFLNVDKNKYYDIISIRTAGGQEKDIYFDISNFYGKF